MLKHLSHAQKFRYWPKTQISVKNSIFGQILKVYLTIFDGFSDTTNYWAL